MSKKNLQRKHKNQDLGVLYCDTVNHGQQLASSLIEAGFSVTVINIKAATYRAFAGIENDETDSIRREWPEVMLLVKGEDARRLFKMCESAEGATLV